VKSTTANGVEVEATPETMPEWVKQMACDEANRFRECLNYWETRHIHLENYTLWALALRIWRTEKEPVDPVTEAVIEGLARHATLIEPRIFKAIVKSIRDELDARGIALRNRDMVK
jgi:hypothetical protein